MMNWLRSQIFPKGKKKNKQNIEFCDFFKKKFKDVVFLIFLVREVKQHKVNQLAQGHMVCK